jgi:Icc-related predicted phosphoesterase
MVFAASDLHGSETCWRKFLNAGRQFDADVLLLNGDVAGKILVPFERRGSRYVCWFRGEQLELDTEAELEQVFRTARQAGQYPYRAASGEIEQLKERGYLEQVFRQVIRASVTEWLELAEDRLRGTKARLLVMPGNDDPPDVAEVVAQAGVENPEGKIVDLDEQHQLVALGYSNITPWRTPRELSEPDIETRLERDFEAVRDPALTIGAIHCPPYDSGLDTAAVLGDDFTVQYDSGHVRMGPVGSTAVKTVIERFQPLASIHGHIHESAGVRKLGTTVAVNPGSDYGDGILRGVLVSISGARVLGYQFING